MKKHLTILLFTILSLQALSQSANELLLKGTTAFEVGNYKLAVEFLDNALKVKPEWEKALFVRGKAHIELGNYFEALDDFNWITKMNSHNAEYLYYKGRTEWRLRRTKMAIADLEQALVYDPNHFEAHQTLGDLFLELKLYAKAKKSFDKAVALNPSFVPKGMKHKRAAQNKEDYLEAMQEFNHEIEENPRNSEALFNRGLHKEMVSDYQGAYDDFTQCIRTDTSMKIAYYYRAIIQIENKDYSSAYRDLKIYLKRYPSDPEAVNHLNEVKLKLNAK